MKRSPAVITFPVLLGAMFLASSCEFDNTPTGPTRETNIHIERAGSERANINLDMGAGELRVEGGTSKLIDGRFEFNVPSWEPKVDASKDGSSQTIRISQPKHAHVGGNVHYVWDLNLNNSVVLNLNVNCGAGKANLDLGDLDLQDVQVRMGAGQVDLDLRGKPSRNYNVHIAGGVGQATVHLPADAGIWAEAHGGLGSVTVTGLDKKEGHWENSQYGSAKANLRVNVEGGIGEIRLIG